MLRATRMDGEADRGGQRKAALLVVAAALLWSTGGVGVKVADAQPMVISGLRSVFALVFMAGVLVVTVRRAGSGAAGVLEPLRRPLVWAAAVAYAVMVVCFVLSARRTTAANAIFIQYTGPVYVALLSGPMLGERVGARDVFAVIACVVGMGLAFGGELGGGRTAGNLLAVVSSLGFAGLPLLLRLDQRTELRAAEHAPLVSMTLGNAMAVVIAVPAMVEHPVHDAKTLAVVAGLGVFQIGVPYVLYGIAVRQLRALESSLLATIEPVLNPVWVLLATGETPRRLARAGGAVIVAAVAAQAVGRGRAAEAEAEVDAEPGAGSEPDADASAGAGAGPEARRADR
jgi:drug/metabolite transporter (DMT)-like permease